MEMLQLVPSHVTLMHSAAAFSSLVICWGTRSHPLERQLGSSTTHTSPRETPEVSAATGPGSINIVDNIVTDTLRSLILRRFRKPNNTYAENRKFFNKVTQKAQKGCLLVSLMFDEMNIKEQVDWDSKKVIGYCDLGQGILNNDGQLEILLNNALIDGLDGSIGANFVRKYITKLEKVGAECISLTSWFPNPSDPSKKVYGDFDAWHMIKLMRNLQAEKQCIRNGAGRVVTWKYLETLDSLQQQEGLHAGHKLVCFSSRRHLSSERLLSPLCTWKQDPLRAINKDPILTRIDQASHYPRGFKNSTGQPLIQGARKTPIFGLLLVLDCIKDVAEDLVWGPIPPLRYLPARKLSQDHFELFFGTARNRTGNNENPTALEFRSAYRKCLVANVRPSTRGNCQVDVTSILQVSLSGRHQQVHGRDEAASGEGTHETHPYQPLSQFAECVGDYVYRRAGT
ncbi:hypothetical protein HPB47_004019 [Ixodes persulcatus]|uniref:Uncharacterized protein n=1 Tax=Ixodes persulcatus TaxID=34615 RepID=A0AC60PHT5_IXOPE|nr:hypothetical protein HPB47_004019 [Ixodes persulcatus]